MGLLQQYQQEHPESLRRPPRPSQNGAEAGFLTGIAMRFSGGKIRDAKQANVLLLIIAVALLVVSAAIFAWTFGGSAPASAPPAADQRQFAVPE